MLLSKAETTRMLRKAVQVWDENRDYFSETDSRFGDGDRGVTIDKVIGLIEKSLDGWNDDDMETFLEDLEDDTMETRGGSAGPLYRAMIRGPSGPPEGDRPADAGTLKEMLTECLSTMEDITSTGVEDKTMMDTPIPAMEATRSAKDDVMTILEVAEEVAIKGVKESEQYVSKYGRIRSYKKKTTDIPDAGAVSTSLSFAELYDGLRQTAYGSRWYTGAVNKIKRER